MQELVVIFAVALMVFGPKRLPELAKTMGKGMRHVRKAMFDIKAGVEREIEAEEQGQGVDMAKPPSLKAGAAGEERLKEAAEAVEGLMKPEEGGMGQEDKGKEVDRSSGA